MSAKKYQLSGAGYGLCIIALLAIPVERSQALDYHVQPAASTGLMVNDNRRLQLLEPDTIYGAIGSAGFNSYAANDVINLSFSPRARLSRYEGDSDLNSDEYWTDAYVERIFPRARISIDAGYSRVAAINSELDDSGNLIAASYRKTSSVSPSLSYAISPRVLFTLGGSVSKIRFDGEGRLTDYNFFAANSNLRYQFSDRTTWLVTFGKTKFDPDFNSKTDTYTWQFGIEHALTDTVDVAFNYGGLRSTVKFSDQQLVFSPQFGFAPQTIRSETRGGGALINFDAVKRFSSVDLHASFDRSLSPSSRGQQNKTDVLIGEALWRIDETLNSKVGVSYRDQIGESEFLPGSTGLITYAVYGSVSKRLSENWRVSALYRYRRQYRRLSELTVDYNQLSISLNYTGDRVPFGLFR